MLFNLYFKIELWHLYKSLLPSAKGLSIYFLCWVITLLIKSTRWRAHCHLHSLLLVYIGYDLTRSLLPWITMFSQSLIFKVLYIYVLRSQRGLARYHFVISCYDYFEKVLSSEFCYYSSLADYAIHMSNCETYVLLLVWLVHNICWNLNVGFSCYNNKSKQSL